jgi:hypothetical protein
MFDGSVEPIMKSAKVVEIMLWTTLVEVTLREPAAIHEVKNAVAKA